MVSRAALGSVVVCGGSRLASLRLCIASLRRHTRGPWELIVIHDGTADGMAAYLAGVQDAAPLRVVVVTNSESCGVAAACNQGLRAARGEHLVLVDADTVVTEGWLDHLAALAERSSEIGLVGPMSDGARPPQLVENAGPAWSTLDEMHRFAQRWRDEQRGRWLRVESLSGSCLLMKRGVFESVGGLVERPGPLSLAVSDLAARARRAGFTLAVARDLFIHHAEGRTHVDEVAEARSRPIGPCRAEEVRPVTSRRRRRVSLTMIVRNEEANLAACLESAAGLFDEMVVVDTGSTDRTVAIARQFGADVSAFAWVDDFAAARNTSLARATGDYAFWLDADDRIESAERERLGKLFDDLDATDAAYLMRCVCDSAAGGVGGAVVDHIRLFPLRDEIRWSNRVHEQILPALVRATIEIRRTDLTLRHVGYSDPDLRRCKLDRDRKLLLADLADRPGDPFVLFNLGWNLMERKDPEGALRYLRASLAASAPSDSIHRKLYALVAQAHQKLGETGAALAACAEGLVLAPGDPELLFRQGIVRRITGDRTGAKACWMEILEQPDPRRPFSSAAPGITGHLTRRNLAALAEEDGQFAEACGLWEQVLAECPGDPEALRVLDRLRSRMVGIGGPSISSIA
jgi:glycosyltransferase involved in cell wall biosynthesis